SIHPITAETIIEVSPVDTPAGAVVLIVDGLGSSYVYPELIPHAVDGNVLDKPELSNFSFICKNSVRIVNIMTPRIDSDSGHSILVTGNSDADGQMVVYPGSTIYDILHENGYLAIAILEKGDSDQLLAEQDVVVHDVTTSINDLQMTVLTNDHPESYYPILKRSIAEVMQQHADTAQADIDQQPEGTIHRYNAYNRWAFDTASDVIDTMNTTAPDNRYILTINVGAVDTAGHYRKDSGYIESIEYLDTILMPLYEQCVENDLALVITSDHGMAFPSPDSRGGCQSEKYASMSEVRMIPCVISSSTIPSGTLNDSYGQEDMAPTILSILNIPDELYFADGRSIALKDHVNLKVVTPAQSDIDISNEGGIIAHASGDSEYVFMGMDRDQRYTIRMESIVEDGSPSVQVKDIYAQEDMTIHFSSLSVPDEHGSGVHDQEDMRLAGSALIIMINLSGLVLIIRIMKKR
ncbi:MAG: alkaline phosphatase family protein, partial [Methanosarcinaceae archaeon]